MTVLSFETDESRIEGRNRKEKKKKVSKAIMALSHCH